MFEMLFTYLLLFIQIFFHCSGSSGRFSLWPNGVVPYSNSDPNFSNLERQFVDKVIKEFNHLSCVKFIPRTSEVDYVKIKFSALHCASHVGRIGGQQTFYLSRQCIESNDILHDMMHTLGFSHEHTRPDRDEYVQINWDNIVPDKFKSFALGTRETHRASMAFPYDYNSVLHFPTTAYSKNGRATIAVKNNETMAEIKANGLSPTDIRKINALYNCNSF